MNGKKNYKSLKCSKEFAHGQSLFKHTKNYVKLQVKILVLASVMKFLLEQTHCLEMFETSVKVILTRQEIHLYDVYAFKCLIGTNILKDMQKLIYQRTNWHVPVVHNTSEKTNLLCIKKHVNQMKTKVDSDFDKDSDNHAMGTTYEASFINMILDLMLRVLEMTLVMQIYQ